MPSNIPQSLIKELLKQESSEVLLTLLTLSHPDWTSPIRLVNNNEDIVSRGNVYTAFPFDVVLPADDGETAREVKIVIDNVSLELIGLLRQVTEEIPAEVEVILSQLPNEVQIDIPGLVIRNIQYNLKRITATLAMDNFLTTELSSEKYTPARYPGLF